jgi:hypothetical protein
MKPKRNIEHYGGPGAECIVCGRACLDRGWAFVETPNGYVHVFDDRGVSDNANYKEMNRPCGTVKRWSDDVFSVSARIINV